MENREKILIVEDELVTSMEIQDRLKTMGYSIAGEASSGDEALRLVQETQPDLVLMDIQLKGEKDGVETAENILKKYDIPIIYLTAYSDKTTLKRAKLTKPYSYLLKPFSDKDLYTAIDLAIYRHGMEKKLRESESWLFTTLNSIGDGVIATDAECQVKFMNPVAETLTGWKEHEAKGKHLEDIFTIINEFDGKPVENPGIKALKSGKVMALANHTVLIKKNGEKIYIDDSAAPIKDDQGNILGAVLVFRDISDRKNAQQEREKLIHQLKETIALYTQ